MKMYRVQHKEVRCRKCGQVVYEDDRACPHCGAGAPGIVSVCPECGSADYVYHRYGYHYIRGALCMAACLPLAQFIPLGPLLGLVFGIFGREETECVCTSCRQGWFPYDGASVSRFNFETRPDKSKTRRFKAIPANCYRSSP
jgi:RNA polymerase subunit RPABC4/transcription elongation factor Spt4